MKKKLIAVLLSLVLMATLVVGCAGGGGETPAASSGKQEVKQSEAADSSKDAGQEPADGKSAQDVKVVLIPKLLNSYFDTLSSGFEKAADELGFEYEYKGPQTGEATSQIEFLEAAIQNNADVIFIAPNSNDALNAIFDDARDSGVKIVVINQELTGYEEHRDVCIMPTDFSLVGPAQLELMGKLMDYEGQFAIMSAATDTPDQNYWIEEIKKVLESDAKYEKMELVEVAYGDEEPEKTTTECEALITKYPDLKGIIAPTAVGLPICAKVVETKGLQDKIAVTGLAMPSDMKAYVDSGTVKEFQLWNPVDEGYLAGHYAVELTTGKTSTEPGATFEAGELGEFTINDQGQIIVGPPFTFTADNINDFDF